jgi:hypothetical protein
VDRYGVLIRRSINENPRSKTGFITSQDIEETFSKALATEKKSLNPDQKEFLILKLFEISDDINLLNFNKIFQIFKK